MIVSDLVNKRLTRITRGPRQVTKILDYDILLYQIFSINFTKLNIIFIDTILQQPSMIVLNIKPTCSQCTLSLPPKSIRKP